MEKKIYVGQKVLVKPINNAARYRTDIEEAEVATVGRKWFTLKSFSRSRFSIDTLRHDGGEYISNYKVYLSQKEIDDEVESERLSTTIINRFSVYGKLGISLEALRKISEVLDEDYLSSTSKRKD